MELSFYYAENYSASCIFCKTKVKKLVNLNILFLKDNFFKNTKNINKSINLNSVNFLY
jgi:hypothetical protein